MNTDRHDQIRSHLFKNGLTPVQTLADMLGASLATIRRDLTEMEAKGTIERLHGSARIATGSEGEVAFGSRENTNLLAKRAIAAIAADLVTPDSTIFLDAGTTVLQLARQLKLMKISLTIFTNGLVVAQELATAPNLKVHLLGGRLRPENMSTTGPFADDMIGELWFDQLFLGASAIDGGGVVSSFDAEEAQLNRKMLDQAAQVFLLADHSKFDSRATYSVFSMSPNETLITDQPLTGAIAELELTVLSDTGTE